MDIVSKEDEEDEEEDDDFERSETPPMDKKQLEENSENSVGNLQMNSSSSQEGLNMTLSSAQLSEMIQKEENSTEESHADDEN